MANIEGVSPLPEEEISPGKASDTDRGTKKRKLPRTHKSHEIKTWTVKSPPFSYVWVELISNPPISVPVDNVTARSHFAAAFTQFLGIIGSAIPVDILKVEANECWIRVPKEDLAAAVAAIGGWLGRGENDAILAWKIRGSGNWLCSLAGRRDFEKVWL